MDKDSSIHITIFGTILVVGVGLIALLPFNVFILTLVEFGFILLMVIVYVRYSAVRNFVLDWIRVPKGTKLELSEAMLDLSHNQKNLLITNREWRKPYLTIEKIDIFYNGKEIYTKTKQFPINKDISKPFLFIRFTDAQGYFVGKLERSIIKRKSNFWIYITYSFPDDGNKFTESFSVTITYIHPHYFFFQIVKK